VTRWLPLARVGVAYSFRFEARGGERPYRFTPINNTVPLGFTLSEDGVLEGTPTQVGAGRLYFAVRSAEGAESFSAFTLYTNPDLPPVDIHSAVYDQRRHRMRIVASSVTGTIEIEINGTLVDYPASVKVKVRAARNLITVKGENLHRYLRPGENWIAVIVDRVRSPFYTLTVG
jgi:hypothetical protein